MKTLLKILIIVFAIIFIVSLSMIIFESCQGQKDIESFEKVFSIATTNEKIQHSNNSIEEKEEHTIPEINIEALKNENPDCQAWLYIEDTNINYPVMQTEEYLYKNFYGNKSKSGTPFIDSRCNLDSDNLIIYGHNMLNGTMFAGLKKYLERSFFDSHSTILLYTEDGVRTYNALAVVKTTSNDKWYSFITSEDNSLIEELINRSIHNITLENTDGKFLTLSTCYGREEEGRLIVVAVEIS